MSISVECPACEHTFDIPSSYGGKKGKCPECGKIFAAPPANGKSPLEPRVVVPPEPPKGERSGPPVPPPRHVAGRSGVLAAAEPPAVTMEPPISDSFSSGRPSVEPKNAGAQRSAIQRPARRKNHAAMWIAFGVLSAMLIVFTVLVVKSIRLDGVETMADQKPTENVDLQPRMGEEIGKPSPDPPVTETDVKAIQLKPLWQKTQSAIYWLSAKQGEKVSSGLAFAIDERGYLATSFPLVKDAELVELTPVGDGSAEKILSTGLIASDRNLALIGIAAPPSSVLKLVDQPLSRDEYLAVCRTDDATEPHLVAARFRRRISFGDLPANSRAAARDLGLDRADGLFWLEHTQTNGATNEGGPLLNADGDVVGINSRLSPISQTGFALPSADLLQLLESRNEPVPFGPMSTEVAKADGLKFDPATIAPGEVPKPPSRAEPGTLESIDVIRELHEICGDIQWQPATAGEYQVMQDLAEYIHVAKQNENDPSIEEGLRILIASAADEVLVELNETAWPDEAKIASLNAFAVEGLMSEGRGIVCYLTIANTRSDTNQVDGTPTILCNLIGTEQAVVVPVSKPSQLLKQNSRWLLIGKHDPDHTFELLARDGSGKVAPLLRAQNLLGEPQDQSTAEPASRRGRR